MVKQQQWTGTNQYTNPQMGHLLTPASQAVVITKVFSAFNMQAWQSFNNRHIQIQSTDSPRAGLFYLVLYSFKLGLNEFILIFRE